VPGSLFPVSILEWVFVFLVPPQKPIFLYIIWPVFAAVRPVAQFVSFGIKVAEIFGAVVWFRSELMEVSRSWQS
jgi:hypothetical protein